VAGDVKMRRCLSDCMEARMALVDYIAKTASRFVFSYHITCSSGFIMQESKARPAGVCTSNFFIPHIFSCPDYC
jgi:hypothetical protein